MYPARFQLPQMLGQVLPRIGHPRTTWPCVILLLLCFWAAPAQAGSVHAGTEGTHDASQFRTCALPASYLPALILSGPPVPGDESIRARLKVCLLQGDMACTVEHYLLLKNIGRRPGWLVAFQNAFAVAQRRAGECEKVARAVHHALREFGQKPEYIRLTVRGDAPKMLAFDEVLNGSVVKTHQVSTNGYHVAVRLGDKIIDAYTGLAGLPMRDYLARLHTSPGNRVLEEVVREL